MKAAPSLSIGIYVLDALPEPLLTSSLVRPGLGQWAPQVSLSML